MQHQVERAQSECEQASRELEREKKELGAAQERLRAREETLQLERASVEGAACPYVDSSVYILPPLSTNLETQ